MSISGDIRLSFKGPKGLKPIARAVKRRYFGVTIEFQKEIDRAVYNADTDNVDTVKDVSEPNLFRCQALGEDPDEANVAARKALDKQAKDKKIVIVEGSVRILETLDFENEPKDDTKMSFI